jgi:hypothetical protein
MKLFRLAPAVVLWACFAPLLMAGGCTFQFARQYDWSNNVGFYFDLEATTDSEDGLCHFDTLTLYLGVADGTTWRFVPFHPSWQYGHQYQVVVTIAENDAELQVDGGAIQQSPGNFKPLQGPLMTNVIASWADSPAAYVVMQGTLSASNSSGTVSISNPASSLPLDVLALAGSLTGTLGFTSSATDTQVFQTSFMLLPAPNLQGDAPLIDKYGQSIQSPWTGKVQSDSDLLAGDAAEALWLQRHPRAPGLDAWGGMSWAGWHQPATGYYTVAKRNGYWWLISPAGNPVFYTGIDDAPALAWDMTPVTGREWLFAELAPDSGLTAAAWGNDVWGESGSTDYYAFIAANLINKYGANWQSLELERTEQRVASWAFSGLGKWSDPVGNLPLLPVIYVYTVPNLVNHIDPFNPSTQSQFLSALQSQLAGQTTQSTILGWSYQNEYDGIVTASEIQSILQMGATVPAKISMLTYAVQQLYNGSFANLDAAWGISSSVSNLNGLEAITSMTPPAGDLEQMRLYYENTLHQFIYKTFKQVDPNHLYFGFWIVPGWWVDDSDWNVEAANCDVIGYDRYAFDLLTPDLTPLLARQDKPTLIGEFSFPPTYGLERGYAVYQAASANDEAGAGEAYTRWLEEASSEPTTVGVMWFQYRDEPVTGRGPGQGTAPVYGEDYAFGTTDVADRPKYDLVSRMRAANIAAGKKRLALTDPDAPASGRKRTLAVDPAQDERGHGPAAHGNHSE